MHAYYRYTTARNQKTTVCILYRRFCPLLNAGRAYERAGAINAGILQVWVLARPVDGVVFAAEFFTGAAHARPLSAHCALSHGCENRVIRTGTSYPRFSFCATL